METDELIHQLAGRPAPVRRLAAPWVRATVWFAISLSIAAAVALAHASNIDVKSLLADPRFIVEEIAIAATTVTAALAVFCSVVPGYDRRILALPLLPLSVWLASLGDGCVRDWLRLGAEGLNLRPDWDCLPPALLIGTVPVIVMVIMLRRGAPMYPRITLALAALAVAAMANLVLRIEHAGDASIMVLAWHFGGAVVLSLLLAWSGKLVLNWNKVRLGILR